MNAPSISIVVPCYNEEEVLPETAKRLASFLDKLIESQKISNDSSILFVDDGSSDNTWQLIEEKSNEDARFDGLKLSRNQGHQNALIAGLFNAKGDAIVSIDADLQDDINAIEKMLDCFIDGYEVVYGVRDERKTDTFFKRFSAEGYYKLLAFFGVEAVFNHADFRLLSSRAIESLKQFDEVNLFLRGIVPLIGYKATSVYYKRSERFAGESKYPLNKMLALAFNGITSISATPLRYISLLGILTSLSSILMILWVIFIKLFTDNAIPGWASSVIPIYFLGGVQLFSIGVVGEYVAKIYAEVKKRPRYFVDTQLSKDKENK